MWFVERFKEKKRGYVEDTSKLFGGRKKVDIKEARGSRMQGEEQEFSDEFCGMRHHLANS